MAYFKALGDGVLAMMTGVSRQAIHKARKDRKGRKLKETFDRALRRKLDLRLPKGGDNKELVRAAFVSYLSGVKAALATDLRKTHKVQDEKLAAQELASILGVEYTNGLTLGNVLYEYCKGVIRTLLGWLTQNKGHDEKLTAWSFGKLVPSELQMLALALRWKRQDNPLGFIIA